MSNDKIRRGDVVSNEWLVLIEVDVDAGAVSTAWWSDAAASDLEKNVCEAAGENQYELELNTIAPFLCQ